MIKRLLSVAAAICLAFVFVSCGEPITADEIKGALPALIDASKPLNEIYFGEGFEILGEESSVSKNGGYYCCDTEKYGLNSIGEIKEATEKVFTKEYAAILYLSAFEGISSEAAVEAPKYSEGDAGLMQSVNADIYELPERTYDYGSIKIIKANAERATFNITSEVNGEKQVIEMVIARYSDGISESTEKGAGAVGAYIYRLDSPTY